MLYLEKKQRWKKNALNIPFKNLKHRKINPRKQKEENTKDKSRN